MGWGFHGARKWRRLSVTCSADPVHVKPPRYLAVHTILGELHSSGLVYSGVQPVRVIDGNMHDGEDNGGPCERSSRISPTLIASLKITSC